MKREVLQARTNFYFALQNTTDKDSINKLYRHARVWTRFCVAFAETLTPEEGVEANNEFKRIRNERLAELNERLDTWERSKNTWR